eukprot:jgi/Psemu1/34405/gm1.34405_g
MVKGNDFVGDVGLAYGSGGTVFTSFPVLLMQATLELAARCLSRGQRKRWNEIVADREILDHSREGFKAAIRAYIINAIILLPDPDANNKGTMIEAFEHYHIMAKPKEVSERAHFNRIDTILDYIDMLVPGDNDHNLTEQQRKQRMFFKTHPKSWQDSYMDTAGNFRELLTILQIRDYYMTRRKDRADKTEKGTNDRTPSSSTSRERKGGEQKDSKQQGNDESKRERNVGQYDDCFERTVQETSKRESHLLGANTTPPVLTTPTIRGILTQTDNLTDGLEDEEDLADDLEVEVMEQWEEDPAKTTTTADDPEVKAMEHQGGEDLLLVYPMKATTTNGGDRRTPPAIITEMPTRPTSRRATPVITWPKDKARIGIIPHQYKQINGINERYYGDQQYTSRVERRCEKNVSGAERR